MIIIIEMWIMIRFMIRTTGMKKITGIGEEITMIMIIDTIILMIITRGEEVMIPSAS